MIPYEILKPKPSWPVFDMPNPFLDGTAEDYGFCMDANNINLGHTDISFTVPYLPVPTMFSHHQMENVPVPADEANVELPTDVFSLDFKEFDPILSDDISESLEGCRKNFPSRQQSSHDIEATDELSLSHSMNSSDMSMALHMTSNQSSLVLPVEEMEINNQLSLVHLVMAYAEAVEKEQKELVEIIVNRMREKVSPLGVVVERVLYYLFQPLDKQTEYLKHESCKNFAAAFKAFYQIFPYGKFAHFAANLAILEAMPQDVEIIHIFEFDMGEGIQWSSVIEAIACQGREVRLISVKWNDGESANCPLRWRFEDTRKRLCDHASFLGLKLKVEEMQLHDLLTEARKIKEGCGMRGWYAFNCMVGLPHMQRVTGRREVLEFLKTAREFLFYSKGIITFGNGDAWETSKNPLSYGSFLEGHLIYYQALFESMERSFPYHLTEARTVMECLFVAPFISSQTWIHKWEEAKDCGDFQLEVDLEGFSVSKESLMEAKEMVREGKSLYGVRIEGEENNEIILEWRGIPLVRVSCWKN